MSTTKMSLIDSFFNRLFNYFYEDKEDRRERIRTILKEDVTCTIDDKEVDCNTWKDDSFLDDLYIRGFDYDKEKDWYVREWTTNTREGVESTLEVYKQDKSTGDWKSLMFGNDGSLFYQEDV